MTKEKTIAPKPGDFLPHHLWLEEMRGALNRLIENPDLIEHLSRIPMGRR